MFAKMQELREEREQGFTLIELLVVILIIGILAAIAIPMFLNQRKSAVDSSVQSDVKNAATNVETLMVKNPAKAVPSTGNYLTQTQLAAFTPNVATGWTGQPYKDIKVGDGTVVKITSVSGQTGGYVICAYNPGGDQASDFTLAAKYDSTTGGLKMGATTGC